MCVVSNIGGYGAKTIPWNHPWSQPFVWPSEKQPIPPTREEFDALKREMQELKKLLIAAKAYDAATDQPDCEVEEKVAVLRRLAELVGVDLEDVLDAS